MLVYGNRLLGSGILSAQVGGEIGYVSGLITDPNNLKIIGFYVSGATPSRSQNILDARSVREYSSYGFVIDSADELVEPGDVIRISEVIKLRFDLFGMKVETKKGTKLGTVSDFTVRSDDFTVQQIVVRRPLFKSLLDPELLIHRHEIIEITDYKIIVKDEEKTIRARAEKEDFIPNFVNPFRTVKSAPAHAETKEPKAE